MYAAGEYDLAGFAVGVVEKSRIIDGSRVQAGHKIVGIASNGLHSNGYSLARQVLLEKAKLKLTAELPGCGRTVAEELLRPTHIYAKVVDALVQSISVKALAHITGGGLPGNLPRPFPKGTAAVIDAKKWPIPPVFKAIQELGPVTPEEMFKTFNMGIGMCLVTSPGDVQRAIDTARIAGLEAWEIGQVVASTAAEPEVTVENLA
jgi:phosphoribosylformylglycinamidine cyclo-ligase